MATKKSTKKDEPEVIEAEITGREPEQEPETKEVALREERAPSVPAEYQAEALIAQAIEKGMAPEALDKFLAMRRELKAERAKEAFDAAMSAFQGECPVIEKTKAGSETKTGRIAFHYAPLGYIINKVKSAMAKNGLSYSFRQVVKDDRKEYVVCIAKHVGGHSEPSDFPVTAGQANGLTTAQQLAGGANTFAKRYAFCNAFGIVTDDVDADDMPPPAPRVVVARPAMPQQQVQTIVVKPPVPPQRTAEPTYHPEASEIQAAAQATEQAATPAPAARHPLMPGQIGQMKTWIKQLAQIRRWTFPDETEWLKTQLTERYRCDQLTQLDQMQAAEFIGKLKSAVEKEMPRTSAASSAPAASAEAAPESATYCPTCKNTFGERGAAADFKSIQTVGWCVACFKASNIDL
jgi:hypothetical protein